MDSNGYNPSVLRPYCNHSGDKARHEVFHGANRKKSKKYGAWLELCPACHDAVHEGAYYTASKTLDRALKESAQKQLMQYYGWTVEEFRAIFGKNYLGE